jgi:hypothetical protein
VVTGIGVVTEIGVVTGIDVVTGIGVVTGIDVVTGIGVVTAIGGVTGIGVVTGIDVVGVGNGAGAATGGRPCQDDDAVAMVGHNDEFVDVDTWIKRWDLIPNILDHVSCFVPLHRTIGNLSENACSVLCADGDKIGSRARVVVALEAKAAAMMFLRVVFHGA